jgi:glycosyltransferase involved in cell wall biosynthesis
MPLGPPIIEWIIAKIYRKRIIYDFDDAIWLTDQARESAVKTGAKWRSKVRLICQWAHKISCGNEYLCRYAAAYNHHIVYNPTIVDTENFHNRDLYQLKKDREIITIGWTGSHSTLKYLRLVEDVLKRIATEHSNVRILIIADQKPESNILSGFQFLKWNPATEIEDLLKIDIGIMPMPDSPWGKGKCGFKAIQYMALAIPPVVSPVGVNTRIVDHGINGYLADDQDAWYCCIDQLLKDASLRSTMGKRGRIKITDQYSVNSNLSTFLSLFE